MSITSHISRLREIALDQHGLITNRQAQEVGVSPASLAMLHKRGEVERIASGVYRVSLTDHSSHEYLMLVTLWAGFPEAALCGETALDLWELCDTNPMQVDVCIGRCRRIRKNLPIGVVVHKEDIPSSLLTVVDGIQVVKPYVAIQQCIRFGTQTRLLGQAIDNADKRGLITEPQKSTLLSQLEERNGGTN